LRFIRNLVPILTVGTSISKLNDPLSTTYINPTNFSRHRKPAFVFIQFLMDQSENMGKD